MNKRNKRKECWKRIASIIISSMAVMLCFTIPVFAAPEYGQNIGNWVTQQAFYIALAAVVIILIPMIMRKAWVPVATTVVLAAIVLFIIKDPARLVAIGDALFGILN